MSDIRKTVLERLRPTEVEAEGKTFRQVHYESTVNDRCVFVLFPLGGRDQDEETLNPFTQNWNVYVFRRPEYDTEDAILALEVPFFEGLSLIIDTEERWDRGRQWWEGSEDGATIDRQVKINERINDLQVSAGGTA